MWIFMDIPCLQSVGFLEGNEGDGQRADDSRLEQLFDMSYVSRVSHRCLLLQISLSRHHFCKRQPWIWNLSWTFTRLLLSTKLRKRANTININLWQIWLWINTYIQIHSKKTDFLGWIWMNPHKSQVPSGEIPRGAKLSPGPAVAGRGASPAPRCCSGSSSGLTGCLVLQWLPCSVLLVDGDE